MYNIAVCDDNTVHLKYVCSMISEGAQKMGKTIRTSLFASAEALQQAMREKMLFHIVFCDVELGSKDGISAMQELKLLYPELKVIFVSGHLEYNPLAYRVEHLYYLLKPLEKEKLNSALEKAFSALDSFGSSHVAVLCDRRICRLAVNDIIYIESTGRTLQIQTALGQYTTYMKLADLYRQLDGRFVLSHKSYISNMAKVLRMEATYFLMLNGTVIPISQTKKKKTREAFFAYIGKL